MRKLCLVSGTEQTFISTTRHQSLLETCHAESICEEYQWQREKEMKRCIHIVLSLTVSALHAGGNCHWGEIQGAWQLTSCLDFAVIALLTSSALLFYPLISTSFNALAWYPWCSRSVLSHLSSQVWAGHPACMYHHPSAEPELDLLSFSLSGLLSRERRDERLYDHETSLCVDR